MNELNDKSNYILFHFYKTIYRGMSRRASKRKMLKEKNSATNNDERAGLLQGKVMNGTQIFI